MLLFRLTMQEKVEQCERQLGRSSGGKGRCTIREGYRSHVSGTHTIQQGSKVALEDKAKGHLRG